MTELLEKAEIKKEDSLEMFLKNFEKLGTFEEKLQLCIDFMRDAISQEKDPNFKGFWEARRLALPVFKENLNPIARTKLWNDFIELTSEAKRLKVIFDEQSVFAIEQLELAISSLEKDIENYLLKLADFPDIEFPPTCKFLKTKQNEYNVLQKELNLLNTFAVKVNALRKEVLKTDMRVRFKSMFFKSLSFCGDKVFPRRNDIIKSVSSKFVEDVGEFVKIHFSSEPKLPAYVLRDEIKNLQNFAKILTLNTKAFTDTRLKLSECWDKLKQVDEIKKKEFLEKRKFTKENFENVSLKIKEFSESCPDLSLKDAESKSDEILQFMKTVELASLEVKKLKKDLKDALNTVVAKYEEEKKSKEKKIQEDLEIKRQKFDSIKDKIKKIIDEEAKFDLEAFIVEKETIIKEIEELNLNKIEKQLLDRALKPVKDIINEKKEKAILDLSEDEIATLSNLKEVLNQRIQRRNEIREQLENYRKAIGGSGFDFEKAILQRELLDNEKERFDKINSSIEEIEEKIAELEG